MSAGGVLACIPSGSQAGLLFQKGSDALSSSSGSLPDGTSCDFGILTVDPSFLAVFQVKQEIAQHWFVWGFSVVLGTFFLAFCVGSIVSSIRRFLTGEE